MWIAVTRIVSIDTEGLGTGNQQWSFHICKTRTALTAGQILGEKLSAVNMMPFARSQDYFVHPLPSCKATVCA